MRLIDIEPLQKERWHLHRYVAGVHAARVEEMELEEVQTVDAVPVVHGKWEPHHTRSGKNWWQCNICGAVSEHKRDHYYCPNCGAKMDLEGLDDHR